MTQETILSALGQHPWAGNLVVLDSVDSTNLYAKKRAADGAPHGTVVVANMQTRGRGRLGRQFASPKDLGIYLTVLLRYDCTPDRLMNLTCVAAEAVRRAIFDCCGVDASIKWINDLVCRKKKLCGILTELSVKPGGEVDYVICGIGVNCGQLPEDFPPEVAPMATSLRQLLGHPINRSALAAAMIRHLHQAADALPDRAGPWMDAYRQHCLTLGQDVQLIRNEQVQPAHVDGVDDSGALLVTYPDGSTGTVFSGEVSVRGLYGYL